MYLNIKNLKYKKKNKKRSKKFDSVKIESFFIKTIKKSINYELNLSTNVKIFSIFHVFFIKISRFKYVYTKYFSLRNTKKRRIRNRNNFKKKNKKYFIKWKKYFIENNIWEHLNNFTNCQKKIQKFYQKTETTLK